MQFNFDRSVWIMFCLIAFMLGVLACLFLQLGLKPEIVRQRDELISENRSLRQELKVYRRAIWLVENGNQ